MLKVITGFFKNWMRELIDPAVHNFSYINISNSNLDGINNCLF